MGTFLYLSANCAQASASSTPLLTKREGTISSKAKVFAIDKIMQHKGPNATVSPDRESKCQFAALHENCFLLSDDGHHLIAPDAGDARQILVEDLRTGSWFRLGENPGAVYTLFFDRDSRTLLAGDYEGHLVEYQLDLQKGNGWAVKKHGNLGIGRIYSSSGVRGFVFFGGTDYKVRVFDLSTKEVLSGRIKTAIKNIRSLRICVVDQSRVYLATLGYNPKYSRTRSDLYDLGGLLGEVSIQGRLGNDHRLLLTQRKPDTIRTQSKSSETLEEKLARLERQLAQKTLEHDSVLARNKELERENKELKEEKAKDKNAVQALTQMNNGLIATVFKLKKEKKNYKVTLNRMKSNEAKLREQKKTLEARIKRLVPKLRILHTKWKREESGSPGEGSLMHLPNPAEVIRDLKISLGVMADDLRKMKDNLINTFEENISLKRKIQIKKDKIKKIRHQLKITRAANTEG